MKDKIYKLTERRKLMDIEFERLSELNTPESAALIVKLKKRYRVLDKKIADLWE